MPARIFDRSSKSLTICSRICADERIVFVRCACVADSAVRDEQLGHADDAVHRRAQLVAHAIEEVALRARRFGELPVALDELARAQLHLGFEAFARSHHLAELLRAADARGTATKPSSSERVRPRTPRASATAQDRDES